MTVTRSIALARKFRSSWISLPAKIQVIRHVRIKYGCDDCEQAVKTTPLPPQPIPKSNASPGLLAYIATAKYADGLPLYRLETILDRYGVDVPRATSAAWMIRVAQLFTPLVNLLRDQVLSSHYVHMDETTVQVLKEPDKPPTSTSYFWALCNGERDRPVILFEYDSSRSGQVPLRLLEGFTGTLHTDGYDGYNAVVRRQGLVHLGCWAHVVRKFQDVIKAQKEPRKAGKANFALGIFKKLYLIEEEQADATAQARHDRRQEASLPLARELRTWLDTAITQVPPTSLLGKAMHYMHNEWAKLIRCFDDGRYALDNNKIENAIRQLLLHCIYLLHPCSRRPSGGRRNSGKSPFSMTRMDSLMPRAHATAVDGGRSQCRSNCRDAQERPGKGNDLLMVAIAALQPQKPVGENAAIEEEEEIDIAAVQQDIERLEGELVEVRAKMKQYLEELGV